MALRDIGRVLGLYGRVDQLCKMIPFDPSRPLSLAESIAIEPRLQKEEKNDPVIKKLIDYSCSSKDYIEMLRLMQLG